MRIVTLDDLNALGSPAPLRTVNQAKYRWERFDLGSASPATLARDRPVLQP